MWPLIIAVFVRWEACGFASLRAGDLRQVSADLLPDAELRGITQKHNLQSAHYQF